MHPILFVCRDLTAVALRYFHLKFSTEACVGQGELHPRPLAACNKQTNVYSGRTLYCVTFHINPRARPGLTSLQEPRLKHDVAYVLEERADTCILVSMFERVCIIRSFHAYVYVNVPVCQVTMSRASVHRM
jgi:hypothetical protein